MSSIGRSMFPCLYSSSVQNGNLENQGREMDSLIVEETLCFDCNPPTRRNEENGLNEDYCCCCWIAIEDSLRQPRTLQRSL